MPHYKCEACKLRLYVSGKPAELVGDLCPECGSLLEPAAALAGLVGFRAFKVVDTAAEAPQSESGQRIADLLDEFVGRRADGLDRDRRNAERWRDHGDAPATATVALPPPLTYL